MALYYELPVYRDVYKLILMIFECTKDFSKEYKYTLGQDMKRDALQLVRNIYRANKSANKKEHLEAFLDDFELHSPGSWHTKRKKKKKLFRVPRTKAAGTTTIRKMGSLSVASGINLFDYLVI